MASFLNRVKDLVLTSVLGFHASTEEQYAAAFAKALSLSPEDTVAMRLRARLSARRFTEEVFAGKWIAEMERLVQLQVKGQRSLQ
jgi:alpha-1,2-mannosyltransferase